MNVFYKEIGDNALDFVNDILQGIPDGRRPEWLKYVNKIVFGDTVGPIPIFGPTVGGTPERTLVVNINQEGLIKPVIDGVTVDGVITSIRESEVKGLVDVYYNVSVRSHKNLNRLSRNPSVRKYIDYVPFTEGKERIFKYIQTPIGQNNSDKEGFFINLYKGVNVGSDKTFNGKISFN